MHLGIAALMGARFENSGRDVRVMSGKAMHSHECIMKNSMCAIRTPKRSAQICNGLFSAAFMATA